MLIVEELCFSYGQKVLFQELSFKIFEGQGLSLTGASGVGKTTLLQLIAGFLTPAKGRIRCASGVSYMTQRPMLLPWRSVRKNLLLPFELRREKPPPFEHILERVGMDRELDKPVGALSLGMQQRVCLARTLLEQNQILLLDEPFASLDFPMRQELCRLIAQLQQEHGLAILLVTHDLRESQWFTEKTYLLE